MVRSLILMLAFCCILVPSNAQQADTLIGGDQGAITTSSATARVQPNTTAPLAVFPTIRASLFVQTVPIMELAGLHGEVRIEDPFGNGWLRGIGVSVGAGYSIYTPSFAPVMLRTLWGRKHYLEVDVGSSIPINRVYGTNAEDPLTWPEGNFNFTMLIGYRFQRESHGMMYRVFMQALNVPGINTGMLPCLGASIGYTF